MIEESTIVTVGTIRKVHGFRGEMMVDLFRSIEQAQTGDVLFLKLDGLPVPFWIARLRLVGRESALLLLEDVNTAQEAQRFVGAELGVMSDESHHPQNEEWLSWQAFVGYTIVADGQTVGRVQAVDDQSENILFYVSTPKGDEIILPIHPDLVVAHDDARHTLHLSLPEGLLTLNEPTSSL